MCSNERKIKMVQDYLEKAKFYLFKVLETHMGNFNKTNIDNVVNLLSECNFIVNKFNAVTNSIDLL